MAEQRAVFKAVADFSSVAKSAKKAEQGLDDFGDAGQRNASKVEQSFERMAKTATKQGEATGKNLTESIKDEVDDLQRQLKRKRLEVDASTDKAKARVAQLQSDIAKTEAELKVNADDTAARERLKSLKSDLGDLQGQLKVDTKQAQSEIQGLRSQLSERKLRMVASAEADQASLAATEAQMDAVARDRTANISANFRGGGAVSGFLQQSTISFGQLIVLAGTLGTALIPVLAAVTTLAAALAAPLAVAGGAATVAGLIMGVAASQTTEQQKAIDKATEKVAGLEKGTKEYNEALKELRSLQKAMTPAQNKFVDAQTRLKSAFERLQGAAGQAIFKPMTQGMNILARVLPKLAPLIRTVSGVMSTFLGEIGQFVKSGAFKQFIQSWSKQAGPALETFGLIAKNMLTGLFGLFRAFAPLGMTMLTAIHQLSIAFREWGLAAGGKNSGVQQFIRYAIEQGPAVIAFFRELFTTVGHLILALAPIGGVVLRIATGFLKMVNAIPTDVLTAFLGALVAGFAIFKTTMVLLRGLGVAVRFFMGALTLNPVGLIVAALVALGAALYLAWQRSSTFRKVVKGAWAAIRGAFTAAWKKIKPILALIGVGLRQLGGAVKWLWNNVAKPYFRLIGGIVKWLWNTAVKPIFNLIKTGVTALGAAFRWLWGKVIKPVANWIGDKIAKIWNGIIKPIFDIWKSVLTGDLGGAWTKMQDLARRALNGVVGLIKKIPSAIGKLGGLFKDAGVALIKKLWDGLVNVGSFAADIGTQFANAVIDLLNSAIPNELPIPGPNINLPNEPIPKLATGGRAGAGRGSQVVIGDGNEPESVLPDSMLRKLMLQVAKVAAGIASQVGGESAGGKGAGDGWEGVAGVFEGASTRIWKAWTGKVRPTLNSWSALLRKNLGPDMRRFENKDVTPSLNRIAKRLKTFETQDLRAWANDWARTFTKTAPADFDQFVTRADNGMDRLVKNLKAGVDRVRRDFNTMGTSLRDTWAKQIRPVFSTLGSYIGKTVAPAFRKGVDAVGRIWRNLRDAAAKPVKFVLETVINKGLRGGINKVAEFAGADKMPKVPVPKFATGGHPGRTRRSGTERQDKIPALLSSNEHVWSAQEVRGAGGHAAMERMRAQARAGNSRRAVHRGRGPRGYWMGGGVFPTPGYPVTNPHGSNYYDSWWAGDMAAPTGTPIRAWKDGVVARAAMNGEDDSYGNVTDINHPDGNWTRYAHQSAIGVRGGEEVDGGQRIGLVGATGNVTGPHLHFEIGGGKQAITPGGGGSVGGFSLPGWAKKIVGDATGWAKGLLDGGKRLASPLGDVLQGALNTLAKPVGDWAVGKLGSGNASLAGAFGAGAGGVWRSLMSTGFYSPQQAAGVMGNMQSESGFNHLIVQGGGTSTHPENIDVGWGLVQWTPGRKVAPYLNGDVSVASQIDALTAQLQGKGSSPEAAAGQMLKGSKTVREAAVNFLLGYERPADQSSAVQAQRSAQAQAIFDRFANGTHDSGGLLPNNGIAINRSGETEAVLTNPEYKTWKQMLRASEAGVLPGMLRGVGPIGNIRGNTPITVNRTTVNQPSFIWHINNPIPEKTSATTLKTLTSVAQRGLN